MKRLMTLCLIATGSVASLVSVKAQEKTQTFPPPAEASFPRLQRVHIPSHEQQALETISIRYREPKVVRKGILAPVASDVDQHKFLLSQKNTGLMRLLPREDFDWEVYQVRKQAEMRGGGAYFSFHYRSHEYGYGSDLSYERGMLKTGFAGADYGMLTDLGDTPLEAITTQDPRAHFLLTYKPARKEKEARVEARKFDPVRTRDGWTGVSVDGSPYVNRLNAVLNHTYLVRSIVYKTSDLLVAFRIVRINDDGGLTIAWKILKEFGPPELKREFR